MVETKPEPEIWVPVPQPWFVGQGSQLNAGGAWVGVCVHNFPRLRVDQGC